MPPIECFMLEETTQVESRLGIYEEGDCPLTKDAKWPEHRAEFTYDTELDAAGNYPPVSMDDARCPTVCGCGYEFTKEARRWTGQSKYWRDPRDGSLISNTSNAPPGAMFHCTWMEKEGDGKPSAWVGPDGRVLAVVTPGGVWIIDSRASNCTLPNDNEHRCWVRHGEPPNITVDKNGLTCGAGGGSIMAGSYHGFLRGGKLVDT